MIFDMDGVLVNTEPLHYECWKAALADEGVDMSYEVYKPCIGSTVGYLMKLLKEAYGETVSDAETLRARMYAKKEEIVQNISEISKYEKEKIGKEIYQRGFVTIICGMIVLAGQLSAALIFAQNEVPGAGILCTSGMMCFTGLMIANGLYTISHAKKLYKNNSITNTTAQHATDT